MAFVPPASFMKCVEKMVEMSFNFLSYDIMRVLQLGTYTVRGISLCLEERIRNLNYTTLKILW